MTNEQEKLNSITWEDLNPDWAEDGDLTDRFNKSQFDGCPGCGQIERIGVYVATEDLDVAVACRGCGWHVFAECPSAAIEKWNARTNPDTVPDSPWTPASVEPPELNWYLVSIRELNDLGSFEYTDILSYGLDSNGEGHWFVQSSKQRVVAYQRRPAPYTPNQTVDEDSEIEVSDER